MIQRTNILILILVTFLLLAIPQIVLGAPDAITYQGKLTNAVGQSVPDGNHSVQFKFYDALTGGNLLWWTPVIIVATNSGVFTAVISGIPGSVFAGGNDRWIETVVNGQTLTPRVKLTSVAYSLGNWSLSGNQGTTGSTNFIGTIDDQPLTFKVFNRTALRLEPVSRNDGYSTDYTVNVIGGDKANYITPGVFAGTIGGGGYHLCVSPNDCYDHSNIVTDDYGTVSGGNLNQAGDNAGTTYDKYGATVGGGTNNTASGLCSTIPGGFSNIASGNYSFAAGKRARSLHDGSFVWADSQNPLFNTTKENTFLIRAQGGVGINNNDPQAGLHVNSNQTDGILAETTAASGIAVKGLGNSGTGVYGKGDSKGVEAYSESGTALHASTQTGRGVEAYSPSGTALYASSQTGRGVEAYSPSGTALYASSQTGNGIEAYNNSYTGGETAAIYAESIARDAGRFVSTLGLALRATSQSAIAILGKSEKSSFPTGEKPAVRGEAIVEDAGQFVSTQGSGIYASGGNWGGRFLGGSLGGIYVVSGANPKAAHFAGHVEITRGMLVHAGSNPKAARFAGNIEIANAANTQVVLELGEGLDYAEGFNVADKESAEPGTVLVIDPENPGNLAISNKPYDRKVAGIVAGANGIKSGVRLGCDSFDRDVALAGRVYCNVDATEAAIEPGDLLTTSSTPGYAMKVTDFNRASGATLGKAMEGLAQGEKGRILVLVTLQ